MPDPNQEPQDIEKEVPQLENDPTDEKRRIKPVIEEVSSDIPAMKEEESPEAVEEPTEALVEAEVKHEEEHHHHSTHEEVQHFQKEESKSDVKLFVIIAVITAVVVAALAGGIYVYLTGTKNLNPKVKSTPEPTAMVESTPEASLESSPSTMKLSEYKVQILNGSGKIGEAGRAKTLIEKAGFKVGNTGNAETFDFTDTIIQVKSSVSSDVLEKLKDSLSSTYSVKTGDKLDSDSDFDIIVTVGSK